MIHRLLVGLAVAALSWGAGCAGHTTSGAAGAACSTIAAPLQVQLAHVSATGASATAIEQALVAIFAAQSPPLSPGPTYAIPSLECSDVGGLGGATGYQCDFQVQVSGGQLTTIRLSPPSTLAQNLLDALTASGAMTCAGKESSGGVTVANVTVSAAGVQYDDTSQYEAFPAPNEVVHGADAESLVSAFAAAGIDDCDPTRYLFLVCTQNGAPVCSYEWMPLQSVGSSYALPVCSGGVTTPGPTLAAAPSLAIWRAIQAAATDTDFKPLDGTIAQATVVNARYFTWDGSTLTFTMVMDDATPPGDAGGSTGASSVKPLQYRLAR